MGTQIRVTISIFRDEQYFHIRKYYRDYEGEYVPSSEGVSFPVNITSLTNLLAAMMELASYEENLSFINEFVTSKLNEQATRISE